ncbi:MAG: class I SAM-dependent methyltransferase [Methanomicrobium sp.]|nr:class I SAM-dependent methyltransferase [Methanomicrobium sp.]
MQNDNILNWSRLWKETTSAVQTEKDERVVAERWNKRWEKRPNRHFREFGEEHLRKGAAETIGFLKDSGFNLKGSSVLDIGCGTGALAIPLAREGADVTALDISSTSLERIQEISQKEGLRINTAECSWWTADIDNLGLRKKFDLVIASRTPAVNDAQSLEKMMACSKNMCYYSSFLSFSEDKAHLELNRILFGKEEIQHTKMANAHHAYTMFFPFMHLYLLGFEPVVKIENSGRKAEIPFEDAAEMAILHLGRENDFDDEEKKKIKLYYKDASVDGIYKMPSRGCHGMMVWQV